jgi:hypothetical protein
MNLVQFYNAKAGRWLSCAALLPLLPMLAGCGRDDIQVYRIAKDSAQPSQAAALPVGWETAPPGEMRVASFKVKGAAGKMAEISVIPLAAAPGHDLDNVNRWRGQVSLPALAQADLAKAAQPVPVAGETAQLYEQAGPNSGSGDQERILVAILHHDDRDWFFKISGDDEVVRSQKDAFLSYVKNFSLPSGNSEAGSFTRPDAPFAHPLINNAASKVPAGTGPGSDDGKPDWAIPANWKETAPGQFLVAKFLISGAGHAQAAVNVSASSGNGGGLLMNVNRWRGQLGLSPAPEAELGKLATAIDMPAGKATLIEMAGTDAKTGQEARMIAIMVPQSAQTWSYKLMGTPALVEENKDAFLKFVQGVKYR